MKGRVIARTIQLGSISSLRCQKSRSARPVEDNACEVMFSRTNILTRLRRSSTSSGGARRDRTDDLMLAKHALSQLSYGPVTRRRMPFVLAFAKATAQQPSSEGPAGPKRRARRLVGLGRLELPTSRLSSARSNQLSYKPGPGSSAIARRCAESPAQRLAIPIGLVRERKRNEDGGVPPMGLI